MSKNEETETLSRMNDSFIKETWERIPKCGKGSTLSSCPAQWSFIAFMVVIRRSLRSSFLEHLWAAHQVMKQERDHNSSVMSTQGRGHQCSITSLWSTQALSLLPKRTSSSMNWIQWLTAVIPAKTGGSGVQGQPDHQRKGTPPQCKNQSKGRGYCSPFVQCLCSTRSSGSDMVSHTC